MERQERYQLRKAAGLYWLLDMEQDGAVSGGVVSLNESGAFIWEQYGLLKSEPAVAERMSREFGITVEEGLEDVKSFLKQLQEQGINR